MAKSASTHSTRLMLKMPTGDSWEGGECSMCRRIVSEASQQGRTRREKAYLLETHGGEGRADCSNL
jgi:hypothetical protein